MNTGYALEAAKTLTTSLVAVVSKGVWVEYLAFCNTSGTSRTVDLADGNGKYLLKGVTVATGGEPYHVPLPEGGLYFAGGFQALASAATAIDMWFRYRQQ